MILLHFQILGENSMCQYMQNMQNSRQKAITVQQILAYCGAFVSFLILSSHLDYGTKTFRGQITMCSVNAFFCSDSFFSLRFIVQGPMRQLSMLKHLLRQRLGKHRDRTWVPGTACHISPAPKVGRTSKQIPGLMVYA